jgi:hypothetical protein
MSLAASMGMDIGSGAPGVVTNKLYQVGGALYFNGTQLAAGSGITLSSALTGFTLGTDGSALSATDTVLQAFQKLQVQVNSTGPGGGTGAKTITLDGQTNLTLASFFINAVGSANTSYQNAIQNKSNGTSASSDYICTTDTGTDLAEYINMGINGSGWTGSTWGGKKDGYLYVDGGAAGVGNLCIGTAQASTFVDFFVGGGAAANRVMRLDSRGMILTSAATDPTTPGAGYLEMYAKTIGGRVLPKWIGPSGVDTPFQPFLGMNHSRCVTTGTGSTSTTVFDAFGGTAWSASASTYAQTTPATGTLKSRVRLSSLTSSTTAGTLVYLKGNTLEVARETGFFMVMRFSLDTLQSGNLGFFGLYSSTTALTATTNQVTSTTSRVGLAIQMNTGNWQLVSANGSAVTAIDLGASFPVNTTDLLELVLFSAPGGSVISYRVTNMTTGATTSGDLSTNLPGNTTYMTYHEALSNNAAAAAVKFSHKILYLETDF